jgi:hypothetical protein
MSIPENDNQLWSGFNGHGLYAKRTERDRDGVIIDDAYARKSELHQLENAVSESTDTELTPNAAKAAIDAIIKAPTPGSEGTMLSYGISQNAMAWDAWESDEMDIPNKLPDHCVLLDYLIDGYHLGVQRNSSYADYPSTTGYAPNDTTKNGLAYFDFTGAPFDRMPYAYFNNTTGTYYQSERLLWSGFNKTNYPDGVSVEFIAKVDTGAKFCQFVDLINAYNFGGIYDDMTVVGSYLVRGISPSFSYDIGSFSAVLTAYNTGDAWHHYAYTADFKNNQAYFFLDGALVLNVNNNITGGDLAFTPCCINTSNGTAKINYGYYLAQVAVWDYPKYTASFTIPRKPLIAL